MYDAILIATDGSDGASTAARHAIEIARQFDAELHVLSVIDTRTATDSAIVEPAAVKANLREICEQAVAAVETQADSVDVDVETAIQTGTPAEEICEYVKSHGIDLVLVGERGHSEYETVLLGSTAEAVVHGSSVPVTVV